MIIRPNTPSISSQIKTAAPTPAAAQESTPAVPTDAAQINFGSTNGNVKDVMSAMATQLQGGLGEYKPGELIVRTRPGASLAGDEGSVVSDLGAQVIGSFDTGAGILKSDAGEFLHIKLPAGVSVEQALAQVSKDARVEYAAPNTVYHLNDFEKKEAPVNDADFGKLWGMNNEGQTGGKVDADIDAPEAWAVHAGRSQAEGAPIIALIDSGIDYNHPDLAANIWVNPGEIPGDGIDNDGNGVIDDVHGYNAIGENGDPMDGLGHGSHCAGTIGAVGNDGQGVVGVNQKANIMAVRIFDNEGNTDAAAIIRGIQYSTKMGARITSNSWGGPSPNAGIKEAFAQSPALHMVAAGNSGYNNDWLPSFPANYALDNIVAVAATDHNDKLADFSQYGKRNVDLGAPGVDILSTVPGGKYDVYSGTSMATPHVSGAAGLIISQYPDISNTDLRRRLLEGTDKVEGLEGKVATGGRLNVHNSLTMELS